MSPRRPIPVSEAFLQQTADVAYLRVVRAEDSLVRYVISTRRADPAGMLLDVEKLFRLRDAVVVEREAYAVAQRALKREVRRQQRGTLHTTLVLQPDHTLPATEGPTE